MRSRRKNRRSLIGGLLTAVIGMSLLVAAPSIFARSTYLFEFEFVYPNSLSDNNAQCALCHTTYDGSNKQTNPYGEDFRNASESTLEERYRAIESTDSDGSGFTNLQEIDGNAQPGWTIGDDVPTGVTGDLDPPTTEPEPPVSDPNGPYTGTVGVAVVFDGSGSSDPDGTIVSYAWDFGDNSSGTGVSPSHTYTAVGEYTVSLTVTDNDSLTNSAATTATITGGNEPPVSDPNGPYSGTVGVAVDFDGTGSTDSDGQIVSHEWDFGDGDMGTGPTPSHVYDAEGEFTVSLTVTDNDGASDTADTTASIGPIELFPPTADAGGPYQGVEDVPVTFDASGSSDFDGTIVTYTWDFDDGTAPVTVTTDTVDHTYDTSGVYQASLTVTDNDDLTGSDTAEVTIVIGNPPPTADAGGPYIGTENVPLQLDGSNSSDDGTIVSYDWDFGDGNTGTSVSPTHTYTVAAQYTVTLTVTDDGGKQGSDTTTADIGDGLVAPVADPGGPYNGEIDIAVTFDGSGSTDADGTIVEWNWNFGDGSTGSGETTSHTYTTAGTYTVTLTVVDDDGLDGSASTTAEIVDGKLIPIADPNGPYVGKEGRELTFDGTGSYDPDGGNMLSYDWDFGDGNSGIGAMPTNVYATEGEYDVTLIVTDDEGQVSDPATTTATIVPDEIPAADPGGPYEAQIDQQPVDFDGSASSDPDGDVVAWDWDFGDGNTGSGETTSHTYAAVGEYTVALMVTDDFGNTDTAETTATITSEPDVDRPPVADANGPYSGLVGDVITFDGTGSTDPNGDETIVSYEWDFGDGNSGTGATVEHAYTTPGIYSVSLTVTDDTGLSGSDGTTADIDDVQTGEGDVYLNRVRVTSRIVGSVGREMERSITVFANAETLEQEAIVVLTADVPDAVEVEIEPESVTETVVPGSRDTRFKFEAEIECEEKGSYEIVWTATITAPVNDDPTNDTATAVTEVECKGNNRRGDR